MRPTLYHFWRSSSSWRVRWALAIKEIRFTSVTVDLFAGEQLTDAHRAKNPMGHIPTLELDGRFLSESIAILEYLDELHPTPALYPKEPWLRARVRQLVELVASGVQPLQNLIVLQKHSPDPEQQKAWAAFFNQRGMAAYERLLEVIHHELGHTPRYSVGETLTAADLCLVPQVYSARRFGVDLTPYPRVLAVETAALASEHGQAAHPDAWKDR